MRRALALWMLVFPETTHRAFRRRVRVSSGQYRRHFRAAS